VGGICLNGQVVIIEPAHPEQFRAYYELRWQLLRAPWEQPRGSERDALEDSAIHLMAIDESGTAIGVGRLHFNTDTEAQIRYMAVTDASRRHGVGSLLLQALERRATGKGARRIVLDARETALGFYRSRGYSEIGTGHVLFGCIRHIRMRKTL